MELKFPEDLKFARSDEWVRIEGDTATVGISDYAQDQLNDLVYLELPAVGTTLTKGAKFGVVESVKSASEVYTPVGGTVTEVNSELEKTPEIINGDPYGNGWLIKLQITDGNVADLLDAQAYADYCASR